MKLFKKIIYSLLALTAILIAIFIGLWIYFATTLDISKITEITQTVDIMDKNDSYVTGVYSKENRTKIDVSALPDHVTDAFIAIEDVRFYKHMGIDVKRIFGALLTNIKSGGKQEGASTITQQLIKLSHLSSKKTYSRKIKEVFLALELERRYTKDEILEMYLNYCYFGNGAYGIEAGAKRYFGISADELSVSQSATLAGILKSPSKYAPHIQPENSMERRNLVLTQMKDNNFITQAEYNSALNENLVLVETADDTYPYGYYIDTVLYEAEQILNMDSEDLLKEGYTIYTSMDVSIQETLENAASLDLPVDDNGNSPQVAMVTLNNKGEILGIVGGKEHTSRRGINRAMDIRRSPGSTIKPVLVYAPAYEQKSYTNATFILDEKQDFNGYSPSNSSGKYYGWVTAKEAITRSLNIPAVKTLNEVGVENAKVYGQSVGLDFENDDDHLALALGGFSKGVTPLEMSAAYQPFMNGGYYIEPSSIRRIEDKAGTIIFEKQEIKNKVLSEETAFLLTDVMKNVVQNGTGKKLSNLNMPIAAKTGTSNIQGSSDSRDAWIVSYTTDYICTAWIGYDNGNPLPSGISGGSYPAQMVEEFYKETYSQSSPQDFIQPEGVVKVKLDKTLLEKNKKLALAGEYAPDSQVIKEYFTLATAPTEHSDLWQTLEPIEAFEVVIDVEGYPVISFESGHDKINYTIMRISSMGQQTIFQTSGQNKLITYKDTNISDNERYKYYVIAMIGDNSIESKKIEIKTGNLSVSEQTTATKKTEEDFSSSEINTESTTDTDNTETRDVGTRKRKP